MADENMQIMQKENTSGMGSKYPAPANVANRFNWGCFLLTWIWGIGNKTYILLVALLFILLGFIPIIGPLAALGLTIWFSIKGNEWAWQNKKWESVEHFHKIQKRWAIAGVIVLLVNILIGILISVSLFALSFSALSGTSNQEVNTKKLKTVFMLTDAAKMNEAMDVKCKLSSSGLAKCFATSIGGERTKKVIDDGLGTVYTFKGDKVCANKGDCKVTVEITTRNGKTDVSELPILVNEKGYVYFDENDIEEFKK